MKILEYKISKDAFNEIFMGHKTFIVIQENSSCVKKGDIVILHEYNDILKYYTGRKLARNVTHFMEGNESNGVKQDYLIISIQ